ncbi:alpha/beta hydrolase [Paremcibacter congregatus]|uniref:Esterase n=1 Tax=Paremcibacter congregatus TaxID=2043170 RepID=A0A2G4YMS3_9PROT|nr:alpha/beta hydrolase [Paremcibacter congregatus]PHZ83624.1 esterase [Paremcibacter congregatus]QDE27324.1 alpha/beta hydrolase [Paremcibacter congregatus]
MTLYRGMDKETLNREYSPSSCVKDIMPYIQAYIDESAAAYDLLAEQCRSGVKYGPEDRSVVDIFTPNGSGPCPVHIFIHGGYWQELSVRESVFAAPNFVAHDIVFMALDYTLAPEASLTEIVEQVRRGVLWILENCAEYGGDKSNITLSGSSAGAHLVAEVLATDWNAQGYEECPIKGACEVSGVFDLTPLVHTYVNDPLQLTETEVQNLSPANHIPSHACPVVFAYGDNETSEFKRQTRDYYADWVKAGHPASFMELAGFNHFDVIMELGNKDSRLFQAVLDQIRA